MAESGIFDWTAEQIEQNTSLSRTLARGTLRLALQEAGLETETVTPEQMKVVLTRVLPGELGGHGIDDAAAVCERLSTSLDSAGLASRHSDSPDQVFSRIGGTGA